MERSVIHHDHNPWLKCGEKLLFKPEANRPLSIVPEYSICALSNMSGKNALEHTPDGK